MFFEKLATDPIHYASVVMAVLISVVLHELGHAYAALWEGDTTARDQGHMDLNPMTHMGPMAIVTLLLFGITWGQCPVNPSRFRHGRKGDALVAFAGPAVNFALGIVFTLLQVGWASIGAGLPVPDHFYENLGNFFQIGAFYNFLLCFFNLLPVPPLDGFTVATRLSRRLDDAMEIVRRNQMVALLVVLLFGMRLIAPVAGACYAVSAGVFASLLG